MPYISATAEIMYAPLDLRLVICRGLDVTNLQQKQVSHGSSRIPRIKKDKSVRILANPWLRLLSRRFGLLLGWRPAVRLERMINKVGDKACRDQNHAESERTHIPNLLMLAADDRKR